MVKIKSRTSVTNYHHSKTDSTWGRLVSCRVTQSWMVRNKGTNWNTFLPPPVFPRLIFASSFPTPPRWYGSWGLWSVQDRLLHPPHFSLFQCGSSPRAAVLQDKPAPTPAPAWVHHMMQLLSGEPAPVWAVHGLPCLQDISTSMGSRVDICPTVVSSKGCRGISALATGAPPPLFVHSPWCLQGCLSHWFSSLLTLLQDVLNFLKHFFPEAPPSWLRGSVMPSGGSVGANWKWLCLAWGSPGLSSQRPPHHLKLATSTQGIALKFTIAFQTTVNQSSFSELCGVKLRQFKNSFEWEEDGPHTSSALGYRLSP